MRTTFYQLPIGARFEFRGRRYEKLGLSLARDEERCGNIFQDEAEVEWDRRPGEEEGAPRPPEPHWTCYLSPAPAPVDRSVDRRALSADRRSNRVTAAACANGAGVRQEGSWK